MQSRNFEWTRADVVPAHLPKPPFGWMYLEQKVNETRMHGTVVRYMLAKMSWPNEKVERSESG
jgi:hypothetical protein